MPKASHGSFASATSPAVSLRALLMKEWSGVSRDAASRGFRAQDGVKCVSCGQCIEALPRENSTQLCRARSHALAAVPQTQRAQFKVPFGDSLSFSLVFHKQNLRFCTETRRVSRFAVHSRTASPRAQSAPLCGCRSANTLIGSRNVDSLI